ncbi:hypothetical protein LTR37_004240 [Vermiconidia calcicola]|uniref:Uncharacterized protein n=1 Tax=Vermiconidia calcicola TaxID=1690605 RepID=A0ACC3NN98_9PEZI|nr:hypothetical protein LTR37_004240 [Vermiconidia calcicola]
MADRYGPPGHYNTDRRRSFHNSTWMRERSPPPRPPHASRSSTLDPRPQAYKRQNSNADPREMTDSNRKRNASQSPEGGQARKASRPDAPHEAPLELNSHGGSNRSSTSNEASRRSSAMAGSHHRRPSTQLEGDRMEQDGGLFVNSPDHKSQQDDASSGRTTPQQRGIRPPPASTRQQSAQPPIDAGVEGASKPVLDLLMNFSSHVAEFASLKISKDQAEARYNHAQLSYNENKKKFEQFPAIKDRKSADREAALNELRQREQTLEQQKMAQQQLMSGLATLIQQASTVKPPAISTEEFVSRADFIAIQKSHNALKQEVENANGSLKSLRTELEIANKEASDARSVLQNLPQDLPQQRVTISAIRKDCTQLLAWKDINVKRLAELAGKIDAAQKQLGDFKDFDLPNFATKKDVSDIADRVGQAHSNLRDCESSDVPHMATKKDLEPLATKMELSGVEDAVEKLEQRVGGLNKELHKLLVNNASPKPHENSASTPVTANAVDPTFQEAMEALLAEAPDYKVNVEKLQRELDVLTDEMDTVKANITEEGKGTVVKRLKSLDRVVNNLSSQVGGSDKAPLQQRVSQLEQDMEGVQKDVSHMANKQVLQAPLTTGSSTDVAPLQTRLHELVEELREFKLEQEEKDQIVAREVEEKLEDFGQRVTTLDIARVGDTRNFNNVLSDMKRELVDVQASLETKVPAQPFNALKDLTTGLSTSLSSLTDDVKGLREQQQRMRNTSQPPTPQQQQQQPPQFPRQSPQMSNGRIGSPLINGVQQQPTPARGHGSPFNQTMLQQPPPPNAAEVQNVQNQVDGLVRVTQHLKQRFDNLTSDEVVRAMVDQIGQIYPHAKNFDNATASMKNKYNILTDRLNSIEQEGKEKSTNVEQLNVNVHDASRMATNAHEAIQRVMKRLNKIEVDVENLRNSATAAGTNPSELVNSSKDTEVAVEKLREELESVQKNAEETKRICDEHVALIDGDNVEGMREQLDALGDTILEFSKKLSDGENYFEAIEKRYASMKSEVEAVKKNMIMGMAKIDAVEKERNL